MSASKSPPRDLLALVIDDDADFRASMEALVRREGFAARGVETLAEARGALESQDFDLVLVDLKLPDGDGLELLKQPAGSDGPEFVVLTGHASLDSAIDVLRAGVLDYLTKPVDRTRLKAVLGNVFRTRSLKAEVSRLQDELWSLGRFGELVGHSDAIKSVYQMIHRVAPTDATVLITGESGTGKELVARTIHDRGPRRDRVFLPVNCGAMVASLIESELFGHEKGSFTGAEQTKKGVFERADGGTLFLDEITEMLPELQVRLLRVLETGQVMRIGGSSQIPVDVRVLAATNREPAAAVKEGKLREDIYYRLNVFPIHLPPLREREDDIRLLAEHFLDELNRQGNAEKQWSRRAMRKLLAQAWPGNIRQLQNSVHRAFILADDQIEPEHVPDPDGEQISQRARLDGDGGARITIPVGSTVADAERALILATLESFQGDKKLAAEALGMSLKTLYNRLKNYKAAAGG